MKEEKSCKVVFAIPEYVGFFALHVSRKCITSQAISLMLLTFRPGKSSSHLVRKPFYQ